MSAKGVRILTHICLSNTAPSYDRDKTACRNIGDRLRIALGDIGVSTYRRDEVRESHDRKVSSKAVAGRSSAQDSLSELLC